jgi:hypothetical protein
MTATVHAFPTSRIHNEPLLTKKQLALHFGFSTRWVELRVREGMPSRLIGNRRRFRLSEVHSWLQEHDR